MLNKEPLNNYILLVEDEESLARGLEYNLQEEGYRVCTLNDGKSAMKKIQEEEFDLVILDIMLPYFDGFQIAEKIREIYPQTPILFLTAKSTQKDRIQGLEIGADDYVTKPFNLEELLLRVKGMLKRKSWYKSTTLLNPVFRFGDNEIDFSTLKATNAKTTFQLTHREAMVLKFLVENEGEIVTRQNLLQHVWHTSTDIETRTIDNFIARLRKYFEPNPSKPVYITSVRSAGYIFKSNPES